MNRPSLINFTVLNQENIHLVLKWRNHKNIRKWMHNKDIISIDNHLLFIIAVR